MTPRTNGDNLGDWFYNANPYYHRGFGLPNCTAYAWGRLSEICNSPCSVTRGNAIDWASKQGMTKINSPEQGSCIIYSGGILDSMGRFCGHIGVVEQVYPDGTIDVSMSSYGGYIWRLYRLSPKDGYYVPESYGLTFHGFYMYDGVREVLNKEMEEFYAKEIVKQMKRELWKEKIESRESVLKFESTGTLEYISYNDVTESSPTYYDSSCALIFMLLCVLILNIMFKGKR